MQSIFKELYNGNISPDLKDYGKDSSYMEAVRVKNVYKDKLTATLDESQKELLEQYSESRSVIDSIVRFDTFAYALRFGILLIFETFSCSNVESEEHAE